MGRLYVAQDRPLERELNSKDAKFGYEMGRGPRPLHRVADIVSKPRIWNHNTTAASLENQPTSRITGDGKDWIQPTSTPQVLVPHKYPMSRSRQLTLGRKPQILRNKSWAMEPYCDRYIYISSHMNGRSSCQNHNHLHLSLRRDTNELWHLLTYGTHHFLSRVLG